MNLRSIRFRITAVAAAATAVVLIAAAIALVVLQRNTLTETLDQSLIQRANDIEALLGAGDPPPQLDSRSAEDFVQVIGSDAAVIVSTSNLAGEAPLNLVGGGSGDTLQTISGLSIDDDPFRVLSRRYEGGVLHVGTTFEIVDESTSALVSSLALTIPIVVKRSDPRASTLEARTRYSSATGCPEPRTTRWSRGPEAGWGGLSTN